MLQLKWQLRVADLLQDQSQSIPEIPEVSEFLPALRRGLLFYILYLNIRFSVKFSVGAISRSRLPPDASPNGDSLLTPPL